MADGLTIKLAFLPGNGVDHRPVCSLLARERNAGKARHAITKLSAGIGFVAGHHAQVWTADYLGQFIGEPVTRWNYGIVGNGADKIALVPRSEERRVGHKRVKSGNHSWVAFVIKHT